MQVIAMLMERVCNLIASLQKYKEYLICVQLQVISSRFANTMQRIICSACNMIASYLESSCNHDPERRQSNLQLFGSVLHRYASMLQRCCNSTLQHPFATIGIVGIDLQVNWDIFAKRLSNVGKSLSRGSRFGCIRVARFMKTCRPNIASKVLINMQRRSNKLLIYVASL